MEGRKREKGRSATRLEIVRFFFSSSSSSSFVETASRFVVANAKSWIENRIENCVLRNEEKEGKEWYYILLNII